MDQASARSKRASKLPQFLRALLVAFAVLGTAVGAAACGPSHPKHQQQGPGGY